ncbi:hypothetical protein SDC9_110870 [bioreactor metagenome]|uniref:Uncharacterized protein n=1 Tax=bioreactor metagenome TaxID=1076179 RepID=A0A645BEV2_9ZZZZ
MVAADFVVGMDFPDFTSPQHFFGQFGQYFIRSDVVVAGRADIGQNPIGVRDADSGYFHQLLDDFCRFRARSFVHAGTEIRHRSVRQLEHIMRLHRFRLFDLTQRGADDGKENAGPHAVDENHRKRNECHQIPSSLKIAAQDQDAEHLDSFRYGSYHKAFFNRRIGIFPHRFGAVQAGNEPDQDRRNDVNISLFPALEEADDARDDADRCADRRPADQAGDADREHPRVRQGCAFRKLHQHLIGYDAVLADLNACVVRDDGEDAEYDYQRQFGAQSLAFAQFVPEIMDIHQKIGQYDDQSDPLQYQNE